MDGRFDWGSGGRGGRSVVDMRSVAVSSSQQIILVGARFCMKGNEAIMVWHSKALDCGDGCGKT